MKARQIRIHARRAVDLPIYNWRRVLWINHRRIGGWSYFKDEHAPNEQREFDNESDANKAARGFAVTRQRRAYVYQNGFLSCWYHDRTRHFD